jgi:hypothetical protein
MQSLIVYLNTVGGDKQNIIKAFGQGAQKYGVKVTFDQTFEYKESDYAVVFAFKAHGNDNKVHTFRKTVFDRKKDKKIFFADSNVLVHYERPDCRYFRFPYKSVFYKDAQYFFINIDKTRVDKILKNTNIKIEKFRKEGNHILLLLNRGVQGYSSFGKNSFEWAYETIIKLRKYTNREIWIRPHSGPRNKRDMERKQELYYIDLLNKLKDVKIVPNESVKLDDALKNCWATVAFSSTASAISLLKGIPTFVESDASFIYDYRSGDFEDIENPVEWDREQFLIKYANCHYNLNEVSNGDLWKRIKDYL